MEVRKITRGDWPAVQQIHTIAFDGSRSEFRVNAADLPMIEDTWAVFDGGRPLSALTSFRFQMTHDGGYAGMSGIAGVATLPQERRRGHVRRLFHAAFAEMRERGHAWSALYPFSFPYYRKFGYELVYSRDDYELPATALAELPRPGTVERVDGLTAELESLYEATALPRNLAIMRTRNIWAERLATDPFAAREFTYLLRDEAGAPIAAVTVKAEPAQPDSINANIRDVLFTSGGALRAMLGHIPTLYPSAERVRLCLPSDIPLELIVPEPYELTHTRSPSVMGRIADVGAALEGTRFPGEGELTLQVQDEQMEWNRGRFHLAWGDGERRVTAGGGEPDLITSIRGLMQLLPGYVDGATAQSLGTVESGLSPEKLASVFPTKALYQNDPF